MGFVFKSLSSITNLSDKNIPNRIDKSLDLVELNDVKHLMPDEISGGMKKRVGIARAFACDAKVLFADEPTGNLDNKTGSKISELLFEVNLESSNALVVVTHDINLAKKCDDQVELSDGLIT